MKDYQKLLAGYDKNTTFFIQHEWGQNKKILYNLVAKKWGEIKIGDKIVISSFKNYGIKSVVGFLKEKGITCSVVGKGPKSLRLVECEKTSNEQLAQLESSRIVEFDFRSKKYQVSVDDNLFSKMGLDNGTRFLLDIFFEKGIDLNGKQIGDFGAGWGAISCILANEFPKSRITAYENDEAAVEMAKNNLKKYLNVRVVDFDLINNKSLLFGEMLGRIDYIITNPPFHVTSDDKELFYSNAFNLLKDKGELFFVVENSFKSQFVEVVNKLFILKKSEENAQYTVFWYTKK